jgi:two-component system, NarL family, nitrate/nitrite response regulator NarL
MRTNGAPGNMGGVALRVVIVDDSEVFLASARDLLERDGMTVLGVATDPAEAVERVAALGPDVVVVDLHLGSASGLDLARLLSTGAGAPAVVLVSSIGAEDLAALAEGAPVRGVLTKTALSADALESIVSGTPLPG